MSDTAIRATQIGKKYQIQHSVATYKTLREDFGRLLRSPFRKEADPALSREEFWALQDINFEIKAGEQLGIVGANGAGKSTLLKILSRIIQPSTGEVKIKGRIGSLLEVGTGFHPELTGRENIFLNGAVLGMSRLFIREHFDEIVEFAGVERFLDTAVKHYSSGMYVRLAFSIAAHLDPEILILDEVLAVGDAQFQKKSLKKMESISRDGRTLIFVSHNFSAVSRICGRVILLKDGKIEMDGPPDDVVGTYNGPAETVEIAERTWEGPLPGSDVVKLHSARIIAEDGTTSAHLDIRRPIGIEMCYEILAPGYVLIPVFHVLDESGNRLFVAHDNEIVLRNEPRDVGVYTSTAWIPGNLLADGGYKASVAVSTYMPLMAHIFEIGALSFTVVDNFDGDAARGTFKGALPGAIRPRLNWVTKRLS